MAYNNSWSKTDGRLAALAGTDAVGTNYATGNTYPNWSVSGQADWVVTPSFYVGGRVGYYFSDNNSFGIPAVDRYNFPSTTNIGLAGIPANLQFPVGYANVPTNSATTFDKQKRMAFQVDGTWYGNLGGQHTIKGGLQIDKLGNEVLSGEQGNLLRFYWDRTLTGFGRGTYGYYQVRSNGVVPQQGFITEGDVSTNNYGLFIQDAWTINNKLTINLGLRTENEKVPAYAAGPDIPTYGVEFSFADKLAPRVGFAYDIKGDGKWKAYGSWGVFYDIFKMELPRGSFGGDKWLEYYYTLDTPNWNTVGDAPNCPPACPGTLLRGPVDFRHPSFGSDAIEPDLKPMQMQEASFGFEHQLSPVVAVSARYIRKWLDPGHRGHGLARRAGQRDLHHRQPRRGPHASWRGSTPTSSSRRPSATTTASSSPSPRTCRATTSCAPATSGAGSTATTRGCRSLTRTAAPARTSAARSTTRSCRSTRTPTRSFGVLATDRPHQFKASFFYQTNFGMSFGLNGYFASGIPRTREMAAVSPNNFPVQYLGRLSDGRLQHVLADGLPAAAGVQAG